MRLVIALGGNALLKRGEPMEADVQHRNVAAAAQAIAPLAQAHEIVLTHGNGPQVGLLALESEAYEEVAAYPLDVLGAESEGMIGYMIEQALRSELAGREVAVLLSQVEVAADDPALAHPTKPIGPHYEREAADRLARDRGWQFVETQGRFRRIVPSPRPGRILELATIRLLVNSGAIVVCMGGGGIPIVREKDGGWRGIEGVIDKDRASAALATALEADALIMLTDVDAVYENWGTDDARPFGRARCAELEVTGFEEGSMRPKIEAACDFVRAGGGFAAIGRLEDAAGLVSGEAGTRIIAD